MAPGTYFQTPISRRCWTRSTSPAASPGASSASANGTTAYHSPYYGAAYPAYHPPTTVNYYGSSCYNCGGWNTAGAAAAGVAVGAVAGAAVASANTAAATANACNAGVAAASSAPAPKPSATFAMAGSMQHCPPAPVQSRRTAPPITYTTIRGFSPRSGRTAFTTAWCPLRETIANCGRDRYQNDVCSRVASDVLFRQHASRTSLVTSTPPSRRWFRFSNSQSAHNRCLGGFQTTATLRLQ